MKTTTQQIKALVKAAGGPAAFCRTFGIPARTVEDWLTPNPRRRRVPPAWLPGILRDALAARKAREDKPDEATADAAALMMEF